MDIEKSGSIIQGLINEYDIRPSRDNSYSEHRYVAVFLHGEWELQSFNQIEEFDKFLADYFGGKIDEDTIDRIVDLETGKDVEFFLCIRLKEK